ncbi:hypothetical protein [Halococcus hamelinensis]|uniref:Uncharacterized protein n=1 Tax=Halococcus hamelinensis 100A6 TaxID=1132509 RepID=M0LYU2_9EURY|nr:hypothetical protein [Halococcus hamelinensis]EMA38606.1 hypothetical protein C447_09122 [Halococcus hamelinensis 100A6]
MYRDVVVGTLLTGSGAVGAGALLVWLGTHGPLLSVSPAVGSVALQTAGANRLVVIAYLGVGIERLYLTGLPLLLLCVGAALPVLRGWWRVPASILLGAAAASTVTVLSGCACASGSATFLVVRTVRTVLNGLAPL